MHTQAQTATALFFERRLPAALQAAPDLFRLGVTYGFRLTGEGACEFQVDLGASSPGVRPGIGRADCTLSTDAGDFEQLLHDPSRARAFFGAGRLRVEGNVGAALHLPALLALGAADPLPPGLAALLNEPDIARFVAGGGVDRLSVVHGPIERFGSIGGLPSLRDLHAWLQVWPGTARLSDANGGRRVTAAQAGDLYRRGHHLAFSDVERGAGELRPWLTRIFWELRLPINTHARCLVYASPDGVGEGLHFDQNLNIILQLRGQKLWRVAPNTHVTFPTTRYTAAVPIVPDELRLYGPTTLPTEMPEEAQEILLQAGSVLVLPRGYWHETRAFGDSLSLNFTFDQPTWADLMPVESRHELLKNEAWRKLAMGAGAADAEAATTAREHLDGLIRDLPPALALTDAATAIARLTPSESRDEGA